MSSATTWRMTTSPRCRMPHRRWLRWPAVPSDSCCWWRRPTARCGAGLAAGPGFLTATSMPLSSGRTRARVKSRSEPAAGIAGFAASHHQALETRTTAAAIDQHAVRFADVRLLIALLRDGDLAKEFIERELGELDDPTERMRELRETLRAYLENGQSVSATAAVRRRDRKTIERQLRSAELLIHHRVSHRCDALLVALRLSDILRHAASQSRVWSMGATH